MNDALQEMVNSVATDKSRPDGTLYRSLSFKDQQHLVIQSGLSHQQVQLTALHQEIVPEVYARNQKTLSCEDQMKLLECRVAVIGLGGLGGTVTEILARIGVGNLTLVDGDCFDDSNLNRQLFSSVNVLGRKKADVAAERVAAVNPAVMTRTIADFFTNSNGAQIVADADIAVDCLDTIKTRFELERTCRESNIPMVSAAIGGTTGQVTVIYPGDPGLSKIYGSPDKTADRGIEKTLGTLPFAAISLAAKECAEVVTIAVGKTASLRNRLLITDLVDHSLDIVELN